MTLNPVKWLERLASGVRPDAPTGAAHVEPDLFTSLLRRARRGELRTGRRVSASRALQTTLTDEQLDRLSAAADAAESTGALRALVLLDGAAIAIDVPRRTAERAHEAGSETHVLTDFDALCLAPAPAPAGESFGPIPFAAGAAANLHTLRNRTVAELLAGPRARVAR